MTSKGSKNKGSAFERKIAHLLDDWWEVPVGTFWRSKLSGGSNEAGDITPRLSSLESAQKLGRWPFVIECKHYKDIQLVQLLSASDLKGGGKILQWWRQLSESWLKETAVPLYRLLFFKGNSTPLLVAFCPKDFQDLSSFTLIEKFLCIPDQLFFRSKLILKDPICICTWGNFSKTMIKDLFKD